MTPPVFVVPASALISAQAGSVIEFSGPEGRHAVTVRRLGAGEDIRLVDGLGRWVDGVVAAIHGKETVHVAVEAVGQEDEPAPRVVVVQALPKGDRGELAVELLTEVGVDVIVPWAAAHCVTQWRPDRRERAHRRWVDAAVAAGKQSRRTRFPTVAGLASIDDVVDLVSGAALAVVLDEGAAAPLAGHSLPPSGDAVIIVGPEGGFSDLERARLVAAGAALVRLGPSVLRTSSAGLAAAAVLLSGSPRWAPTSGTGMEG